MNCCLYCKYSTTMQRGALACLAQKGMPFVRHKDCCDSFKPMKPTNYDRIISKSPEELADLIFFELAQFLDRDSLLAWLREEVKSDA